MSNYNYEKGAIHHDNHKEFSINVKSVGDLKSILRELLKDDEEEARFEEVNSSEEATGRCDSKCMTHKDDFAMKIKKVTDTMWEENVLSRKYDYAFLKMYMDKNGDFQKFKRSKSFLDFLTMAECKNVPSKSNFDSYYDINKINDGKIKYADDRHEEIRRNDIVARFIELMR